MCESRFKCLAVFFDHQLKGLFLCRYFIGVVNILFFEQFFLFFSLFFSQVIFDVEVFSILFDHSVIKVVIIFFSLPIKVINVLYLMKEFLVKIFETRAVFQILIVSFLDYDLVLSDVVKHLLFSQRLFGVVGKPI